MSGPLELAAGVFAVIGVADVAVRTGRDFYGFLRKIADAPNEVEKLCVVIQEVTLLAEASKELFEGTGRYKSSCTTRQTVNALEMSLKSFNREIKSLKALSSRFRGTIKSWSRVRYVLDERKINKALESLERSKSLLGNALILACRYVVSLRSQVGKVMWTIVVSAAGLFPRSYALIASLRCAL